MYRELICWSCKRQVDKEKALPSFRRQTSITRGTSRPVNLSQFLTPLAFECYPLFEREQRMAYVKSKTDALRANDWAMPFPNLVLFALRNAEILAEDWAA